MMKSSAWFVFIVSIASAFTPSDTPVAAANGWQSGKIVRAAQPERRKPEPYEVWNPTLTHWYTLETPTETIKATEMVPAGVKRGGPGTLSGDVDRNPPMGFRVGETVRFSLQDQPPDPKKNREMYVLDRKGKKHVLKVDEIVRKGS